MFGEDNPIWCGDTITYGSAHQRVSRRKGKASDHLCIDCGLKASQWSYNHSCPKELHSQLGPYSPDWEQYDPRCVPCHKKFDLSRLS